MDILFAWIASIATGFEPLIIKASSKSLIKNPWLFNFYWLAFNAPFVIILALFKGGRIPTDWSSILLVSVSAACFYLFYTVSLYTLDVTTVGPLFSLRTVFAVILGIVVLNEKIGLLGGVLIAIIVLLSPFAAYDEHLKLKAFFHKYILLAIIAMLALAFMGYFPHISVARNGYATTLLWQDITTLVMLLPTLLLVKKEDHQKLTVKRAYPFIMLGIMSFIYTSTTTLAYAHNLALSSVIVSLPLSMLFTYMLSRKYATFLEKHSAKIYVIRFSAAIIMVGCAIYLSLLS